MEASSLSPNPVLRSPPRFDIYGWEMKGPTVQDQSNVKLPPGWSYDPPKKTQERLFEERKRSNLPDISFDLDRDGKVGGQDLVIGKLFDKDGDGRLNTGERKEADKAVAEFIWGVEQAAPSRPFRLIQKRGVVIDNEDFAPVAGTYSSPHARSVSPIVKTYTQLKDQRAKERLQSLKQYRDSWEHMHPQQMVAETQEYRRASLPYKTYSEKREIEAREARKKAGLSPNRTDVSARLGPSLTYMSQPKYRSKSHMKTQRHADTMQDLADKQNSSYINPDQRLELRESQLIAEVGERQGGKTYQDVKERMRQEAIAHNAATFSKVTVGIHGQELPKFAEEQTEYWKSRPGYVEQPVLVSHLEQRQQKKYWAPRDIYRLSDKEVTPPPQDPFKATHIPKVPKPADIPAKPTQHTPVDFLPKDLSDPNQPPPVKHTYRWTALMHIFNKGSVFKPRNKPEKEETKTAAERKECGLLRSTKATDSPGRMSMEESVTSGGRKWSTFGSGNRRVIKPVSSSLVRTSGFPISAGK